MKFTKRIPARVEERTVISRTTCDFCGAEVREQAFGGDTPEITIEAKLGDVWPEGDNRKVHSVDCCEACFLGKVRPALEALGAKFRERDAEANDAFGLPEDPLLPKS